MSFGQKTLDELLLKLGRVPTEAEMVNLKKIANEIDATYSELLRLTPSIPHAPGQENLTTGSLRVYTIDEEQ